MDGTVGGDRHGHSRGQETRADAAWPTCPARCPPSALTRRQQHPHLANACGGGGPSPLLLPKEIVQGPFQIAGELVISAAVHLH